MLLTAALLACQAGQPPIGIVTFDSDSVHYTSESRRVELLWADLDRVLIKTTDEGPMKPDVFFVLEPADGVPLEIPSEAQGTEELLLRLQELPNFDSGAVIEASGSTEKATFLCWKKGAA